MTLLLPAQTTLSLSPNTLRFAATAEVPPAKPTPNGDTLQPAAPPKPPDIDLSAFWKRLGKFTLGLLLAPIALTVLAIRGLVYLFTGKPIGIPNIMEETTPTTYQQKLTDIAAKDKRFQLLAQQITQEPTLPTYKDDQFLTKLGDFIAKEEQRSREQVFSAKAWETRSQLSQLSASNPSEQALGAAQWVDRFMSPEVLQTYYPQDKDLLADPLGFTLLSEGEKLETTYKGLRLKTPGYFQKKLEHGLKQRPEWQRQLETLIGTDETFGKESVVPTIAMAASLEAAALEKRKLAFSTDVKPPHLGSAQALQVLEADGATAATWFDAVKHFAGLVKSDKLYYYRQALASLQTVTATQPQEAPPKNPK